MFIIRRQSQRGSSSDDFNNYRPLEKPMGETTAKKVNHLIKLLLQGNHIDKMTAKWVSLTPNPLDAMKDQVSWGKQKSSVHHSGSFHHYHAMKGQVSQVEKICYLGQWRHQKNTSQKVKKKAGDHFVFHNSACRLHQL